MQAACNCRCDIQGLSRLKATKSAMRNSARLPWNRGRCSVLIRKPVSQPSPELKLEAQQTKQRALFNMAVNDLHLHPQAVPGFASPDACTCTVRLLHVCMHVPLYLEIAAAPPPTRGPSDMTRHGANSRGKCHLLPPPFHLIPCRGGGEKDFAYITATTMGLAAIRIGTGTGRANNSCEKRLGLLFGPPAIASVSNVQVKIVHICGLEAGMRREYGGGGPKAHDLRPCVRGCGIRDKTSVIRAPCKQYAKS